MSTSVVAFRARKGSSDRLTMVTCYDVTLARLLAASEIDALLVGDSVAMVVHGHATTIPADLEMMVAHTAAVSRGSGDKLVVADMPFLAHRRGLAAVVDAAGALMRAGAHAVKLEGAAGNRETIDHLVHSGVPVMGHVGLTPQFVNNFGGFKVQGRTDEAAAAVLADAKLLEEAGVFSIVIEGVPASLGAAITASVSVPTIGIGAGAQCDGQILVLYDVLGLTGRVPRFVRRFGDGSTTVNEAISGYVTAVRDGSFPAEQETYG